MSMYAYYYLDPKLGQPFALLKYAGHLSGKNISGRFESNMVPPGISFLAVLYRFFDQFSFIRGS